MKDLYFVDAYNVIFRDPDRFPRDDLESSRKMLLDLLLDFGAHNDVEIVVVFDGQGPGTKAVEHPLARSFTEVFTPKTMTADSYIEKESYRRRGEYRSIYVVSSDGSVQSQILGNGAYRMAVTDLMRVLSEDKRRQHRFMAENNRANLRNEVGQNLPDAVREKLEGLRKGKP